MSDKGTIGGDYISPEEQSRGILSGAENTPASSESKMHSGSSEKSGTVPLPRGLDILPPNFDEADGSWKTILSRDPFEQLYLDYRLAPHITIETVKRHYSLLEKFWAGKYSLLNTGGNRIAFKSKYGDGTIENSLQRLKKAFEKLSTAEGIERYASELNQERIKKGSEAIHNNIEQMMLNGLVKKSDIEYCIKRGEKFELSMAETAVIIKDEFSKRGFVPENNIPSDLDTVSYLLSADSWMTPERLVEETKKAEEIRNTDIQILPGKFARRLQDIGSILYQDPAEAKSLIKDDLLKSAVAQKDVVAAREVAQMSKNVNNIHLAFLQIIYRLNPALPYRFTPDREVHTTVELANALYENDETVKKGKEDLKRGYLECWLQAADPAAYQELIHIRDSGVTIDNAFLRLIYKFNPTLPYRLSRNVEIRNVKELILALNSSAELWFEGKLQLYNGTLCSWLQTALHSKAAASWETVQPEFTEDQDLGLEHFIRMLEPGIEKPVIKSDIEKIEYPAIQSGDIIKTTIPVENTTRGYANVSCKLSSVENGITIDKTILSLNNATNQQNDQIELEINSNLLVKGIDYDLSLTFFTSMGQEIRIPITFRIVFPKRAFTVRVAMFAGIFGLAFGLIRFMISSFSKGWFPEEYKSYMPWDIATAVYKEIPMMGVGFLLIILVLFITIYNLIKFYRK